MDYNDLAPDATRARLGQDMSSSGALSASNRRWLQPLALLLLVLIYLATVLPNLANDPIVGGDEGWIISASAKLAGQGVFGSDLFAGFYDAEDHYYFNLPLHHIVLAGVFEVTGSGIVEARLASVVFGLLALLLTYALGRKIAGPGAGLLAAALLVLLRLNLTPFSGLTLTDLGATVRYDLIAVPYGIAAVLILSRSPFEVRLWQAAVAGLLVGLAALTQFIGAFFVLPLALYVMTLLMPLGRRLLLTTVLGLAMLAPFLPYGLYIAADLDDFRGQARAVEQEADLLSPAFYVRQLRDEPDRYNLGLDFDGIPSTAEEALRRPSARLALLVALPIAAVYLVSMGRSDPRRRLLAFVLIGLVVQLALFESTKRFVYWVVVVPFLCIAIPDLAIAVWRLHPSGKLTRDWSDVPLLRWLAKGAVGGILAVVAIEGLAVAAKDVRDAPDAPGYADVGSRLREAIPDGSSAAGDNRLWPALRDRDYRSLHLLFYYTNPDISRDRTTDVFGAMDRIGADYLLLSPLGRDILTRLSPDHAAEFERYMSERAELVTTIDNAAYGPIEVYRLR
ncbi:MAG: hypothetical protein GEU75_05695 [Dehalococcoidia bacterium]|nr:hypothetical protein [Dehalococcoidia bacterium]